MKVASMKGKNGRAIPNQFIIKDEGNDGTVDIIYFQSYESIIVKITSSETLLDETYWNYSKTTAKYRNQFLGETTKETEKLIKDGVYKLVNLN